jgi:hypothetical protein
MFNDIQRNNFGMGSACPLMPTFGDYGTTLNEDTTDTWIWIRTIQSTPG